MYSIAAGSGLMLGYFFRKNNSLWVILTGVFWISSAIIPYLSRTYDISNMNIYGIPVWVYLSVAPFLAGGALALITRLTSTLDQYSIVFIPLSYFTNLVYYLVFFGKAAKLLHELFG